MTLHHQILGPTDAPPVLFAGSLGTDHTMWNDVVARLSLSFKTIAYDQLGHGGSPSPPGPYSIARLGEAALALLDALQIKRASFVGLSIGGMIGQWLGAHAPDRIDRLVLLCTSSHLPPAESWLERAHAVRAARSPEPIADAVVARWLTPAFAQVHPGLVGALRAMVAGQPADGYAACCQAIATMDQRDDLRSITARTLVIGGAQDAAIPPDHQRHLVEHIPGARLVVLDPGAHVVALERGDDVARLITDHLEAP